MNRNVESHFSQLPSIDIQRSIFNRSSSHKTTFNTGELIPIYIDEVLPGDTFTVSTSKVVRLQTLLTPIMDNMYLDTYWFYVPNRLVWSHWREFCGENTESAWVPTTSYTIPKIKSPDGGFASGTIADYFGLPVGKEFKSGSRMPSALPFRGLAMICNEFFRDENLTDPLNIYTGDATVDGSNGDNYITDVALGGKPFKVAKYHDYFSSCLPNCQKGSAVQLPGTQPIPSQMLPVYARTDTHGINAPGEASYPMRARIGFGPSDPNVYFYGRSDDVHGKVIAYQDSSSPTRDFVYPSNLWALMPELQASASISINDLRLAFQLQKYLERNARGGTRYIEILKSHFGVTSPDARLQRPEYLGGNRIPLQIHQVTNTAQSETDFLGDLGAQSVTADVHADFEKSFTEHGYLMCLACVRYDHTYSQGIERFWSRNTFTDFYLPVFANISEQPVYTSEIYYDPSIGFDDVFGYQEAWADYRYKPNRVSGEMRPGIPNTLASWHLADYYTSKPTLSDGWIREDKTNVDRALAVTSAVSNQILLDCYFDCTVTRPMPMYSIPGLIDHN